MPWDLWWVPRGGLESLGVYLIFFLYFLDVEKGSIDVQEGLVQALKTGRG